jgi:pectate lyase
MRNKLGWWFTLVFTVSLALGMISSTGVSAATLFSDDFQDGNSSGWGTSNGSWSVVSDGSYVYKQSSTSTTAHAYNGTAGWTNYSVQARAKALAFNGSGRYFGIAARYTGTSNYYFLVLTNSNTVEIRKKISGASTTLASKAYTVTTGTWYTLKLIVNGTGLTALVNGVQELSASDSAIASGKIALITYNTSAEFDDVLVEDLGGGTATPTPTPVVNTPTPTPVPATPTPTPSTATPTPTPVPSTPTPTPVPATPTPTPIGATPTPTPVVPTPTPITGQPDFSPIGFCNDGSTITGGAAGPTVYVSSAAELEQYSDVNDPYTIYITASFNLSGMETHIRSNKTVIGVGNVTLSGGGLYLYRSSNVIIRNLTITGSPEDNIGIHYSDHIWIDHCTFSNSTDGNVDITQASDYITISWCKFFYTVDNGHNFVSLIAASDSDDGSQYHVTYHHNWWGELCRERLPSVRFGRVHLFNNYYNAPGNNYCARTRVGAELRVENNFFENVRNPWEQYVTGASGAQGKLFASGNNVGLGDTSYGVTWTGTVNHKDGTVTNMLPGTDNVFAAPYSYSLHNALDVKSVVTTYAGAGKGPFAQ